MKDRSVDGPTLARDNMRCGVCCRHCGLLWGWSGGEEGHWLALGGRRKRGLGECVREGREAKWGGELAGQGEGVEGG